MSQFESSPMKDLRGYLDLDEIKKLLDAPTTPRNHLLIRLLWVTGARVSELTGSKEKGKEFYGLRVKDLDQRDHTIILDTLKRKQYPPLKRRVTLDLNTWKQLTSYINDEHLGLEDKILNIKRSMAGKIIRKIGEEVGVEKVGIKKIHPHHFRHSHSVAYIRGKGNNSMEGLRRLQMKLGHANINTTAHYLQFAPEENKDQEDVFGKF